MLLDLNQILHELHAHPETGFNETWTSDYLSRKFRDFGLQVFENIAKTGFAAILPGRDRSRAVGYRADMDALPIREQTDLPWASQNGCMHACGHDVHMTVALGIAHELAAAPEAPECDVVFVLQPNEEGAPGDLPSGAELMCREGVLDRFGIRRMLALHCDPGLEIGKFGVCRGAVWAASGRFTVQVSGKSAHAAYPERGRDALWAASEMVTAIYSAIQRQRPAASEVVSVCKLNAGTAFNVIAGQAQFEGIMRGPSRQNLIELGEIIRNTCQNVARYCQVEADYQQFWGANAVINDDELTQIALDTWQPSGVAQLIQMSMASEDFSHFSERIPCFYAMLGIRPHDASMCAPLHADNFIADESVIPGAIHQMTALIRRLMN